MNRLHAPGFVLLAGMALFASSVCAQGKGNFESAPAVAGSELANSTLLSGASHSVAQPVQIENNFGRFVIDAKVGKFSVLGVNMLGVRASELQAIETLQKVQQDSAFTDALAKSASQIAGFAKAAVTEPGQTVENIGKGVGTVFGRLGYLAHSGANYVSDQASDLTSSRPPMPAWAHSTRRAWPGSTPTARRPLATAPATTTVTPFPNVDHRRPHGRRRWTGLAHLAQSGGADRAAVPPDPRAR